MYTFSVRELRSHIFFLSDILDTVGKRVPRKSTIYFCSKKFPVQKEFSTFNPIFTEVLNSILSALLPSI